MHAPSLATRTPPPPPLELIDGFDGISSAPRVSCAVNLDMPVSPLRAVGVDALVS